MKSIYMRAWASKSFFMLLLYLAAALQYSGILAQVSVPASENSLLLKVQDNTLYFYVPEDGKYVNAVLVNTLGQSTELTAKVFNRGNQQLGLNHGIVRSSGIYVLHVVVGDSKASLKLINVDDSFLPTATQMQYDSVIDEKRQAYKNTVFKFEKNINTQARLAGPLTANSILDFDGDGKEDILKMWNDEGAFTADVHLSTGSSFAMQRWATKQGGYWSGMQWFVGDFNGDGKTDLMKLWDDYGLMTTDVHISTGSSFIMSRWATQQGGLSDAMKWFVGDFNGDGKTDLMKLWDDYGLMTTDVHISTGSSFIMSRWATQQGGLSDAMKWFVGDYNGDGKTDLMKLWDDYGFMTSDVHMSNGSSFNMSRWATQQGGFINEMKWYVGDFNGDGKSDMMKVWNDQGQTSSDVHLSTGWSFNLSRWATQQGGFINEMKWFVGDFNGDGKTDMMKVWNDQGQTSSDVHLSTGWSFNLSRWATQQGGFINEMNWYVGDFNGDGNTDMMKVWNDQGQASSDVHLSTGWSFNLSRWATQQGGYWAEQQWAGPDGYVYGKGTIPINNNRTGATFVLYASEYDAVQAAVGSVWDNSINEHLEYGGVIYKLKGADFWGYVSIQGAKHSIETNGFYPTNSDVTAYWHTHPNKPSQIFSLADYVNTQKELKTKRLYTVVYKADNQRLTPTITSVAIGADGKAVGNADGKTENNNWPAKTPQEYIQSAALGATVCLLDSWDNQTYKIELNDFQRTEYIKGTVAVVGLKYTFQGNKITFNVGPVGVSTTGDVSFTFGGTLFIVQGSVAGKINVPAILQGNWKEILRASASGGFGAGFEVEGVGLAGSTGTEGTITFKEEGPDNNWGSITNGIK